MAGSDPNKVKIKEGPLAQPVSKILVVTSRLSNYSLKINLVDFLKKILDLNLKEVQEERIKGWKILNFV